MKHFSKEPQHLNQGPYSRKVLARAYAQSWDFCLKFLPKNC